MPLPENLFFTVKELAGLWKVPAAILGKFAVTDQLTLSFVLSTDLTVRPMNVNPESPNISISPGIVSIFGADVWPAFKGEVVSLTRVRGDPANTVLAIQPDSRHPLISVIDLIVLPEEKRRFEIAHNLEIDTALQAKKTCSRPGRPPSHKWNQCYIYLAKRVHDFGLPETQGELVRIALDWFAANFPDIPEISYAKKMIQPFWREFHEK